MSYNFSGKLLASSVQFVSNIALSRVLGANDFGIFNISNIFNNMLGQFNEFGVNTALIQKNQLSDKDISTAILLKALISITLTILTYALAPIAAAYFNNTAITNVIRVTSINFTISIFFFVPNLLLVRVLAFKTLVKINTFATVATSAFTVILAYCGYGYWSLVYSVVINSILNVILFNVGKFHMLRLGFDADTARHIIRFGGSVLLTKLVVQAIFSSDNFIIGHVEGSEQLGYYATAFNWGAIFCGIASTVISGVAFPTFSSVRNDTALLRQGYLKIIGCSALLGAVIYISLFVAARDFLIGILGAGSNKWLPSLACLRIFCIYGLFRIILEPIGGICLVLGKPSVLFKANLLAVCLQLLLLYPVLKLFSMEGVAVLVTVSYISQYLVYSRSVLPQINITSMDVLGSVAPIIALLPFTLLVLLEHFIPYNPIAMVLKVAFTATGCLLVHSVLTRWHYIKEIRAVLSKAENKTYS